MILELLDEKWPELLVATGLGISGMALVVLLF